MSVLRGILVSCWLCLFDAKSDVDVSATDRGLFLLQQRAKMIPSSKADCFIIGAKRYPIMDGFTQKFVTSPEECQKVCADVQGCEHFTWWANTGGCRLQDKYAEIASGGEDAITGRRDCLQKTNEDLQLYGTSPWERAQAETALHSGKFARTRAFVDTRPRMIACMGCSISEYIETLGAKLLRQHGVPVRASGEIFHHEKNPYYSKTLGLSGSFRLAAEHAATEEAGMKALVFRGWLEQGHGLQAMGSFEVYRKDSGVGVTGNDVTDTLAQLETQSAVVWRRNLLDQVICAVRDCFALRLGYPVDGDGDQSKLCFGRRKAQQQERVILHPTRLVHELKEKIAGLTIAQEHLKKVGLNNTVIFSEALTAFEIGARPGNLRTSIKAWEELLHAWDIEPVRSVIKRQLLSEPLYGKLPPRRPHQELIYNFDEVQAALRKEGLGNYIREMHPVDEVEGVEVSTVADSTSATVAEATSVINKVAEHAHVHHAQPARPPPAPADTATTVEKLHAKKDDSADEVETVLQETQDSAKELDKVHKVDTANRRRSKVETVASEPDDEFTDELENSYADELEKVLLDAAEQNHSHHGTTSSKATSTTTRRRISRRRHSEQK